MRGVSRMDDHTHVRQEVQAQVVIEVAGENEKIWATDKICTIV